jgi:outer membrane protein OmpA-like peptidoglycan-associated protein
MWVLMIGLASCQDVAEQPAPSDTAAAEPGYPSLHTVPPRPQLSYTVEQRRAIVDGLIADRENARYSGDVVRYRAGLNSLPPPAAPALAAVPVAPEPDAPDAAHATTRPIPARDVPAVDPETEFLYEDDDLDTFMEEMDDGGAADAPGDPEANAAPLETRVVRASATRPIYQAAYPGRPPVVTLAMPPATASLPVPTPVETALAGRAPAVVWGMPDMTPPPAEPDPTATSTATRQPRHAALLPPPPPVETSLAARAPGVVWGMPDMAPAQAQPTPAMPEMAADGARHASPPPPAPVETKLAGRAPGVVWGMPDMAPAPAGSPPAVSEEVSNEVAVAHAAPLPAPAKPRTAPVEVVLAGAAAEPAGAHDARELAPPAPAPDKPAPPAPVNAILAGPEPEWAPAIRTVMVEPPAEPPAENGVRSEHAAAATHAPPPPAPAKPALDSNQATVAPGAVERSMPQPLPKPVADAAGIEVAGGLVDVDAASRDHSAAALMSVPFDPRSAMLTPDALARLEELLAEAQAPAARIKIVGEADAPALALDRALAVGLALVQSGVPADRLELTLAHSGSDDQARLFLAAPEL